MPERILVVEDNELNMELLVEMLKTQGEWEILKAADGEKALEAIKEKVPDLVLLDIQLPGMDGYQVLKKIREKEELSSMPVIGVTAYAMKGDRERILSAGFDGYIAKPIDINELIQTIREVIK